MTYLTQKVFLKSIGKEKKKMVKKVSSQGEPVDQAAIGSPGILG